MGVGGREGETETRLEIREEETGTFAYTGVSRWQYVHITHFTPCVQETGRNTTGYRMERESTTSMCTNTGQAVSRVYTWTHVHRDSQQQ